MTPSMPALRPPELDHAEAMLRQCHRLLLDAEVAMPVMTIDWFGPASDLWRMANDRLRARVAGVVDEARLASESIRALQP